MSDSETAGLLARIRALEGRLVAETTKNRSARKSTWEINTLLVNLQAELLNPVYAIISNSEVLADVDDVAGRQALTDSTKLAARLLESTLTRLIELARMATSDFQLEPSHMSLHSLTYEACMLAQATRPRNNPLDIDIHILTDDYITHFDSARMAHLISSAILSVVAIDDEISIQVVLRARGVGDEVECAWSVVLVSSESSAKSATDVPLIGQPMAGNRALGALYTKRLAEQLGAKVEVGDVPNGLQITMKVPLVRCVAQARWSDQPVKLADGPYIVVDEPPTDFTPLPVVLTELPENESLSDFIAATHAKLVILHHEGRGSATEIRGNIAYCLESTVPVLLRASSLSYEELSRYRRHLDAIVLEPSSEHTLMRYVAGLSKADSRSTRRLADIH